MLEITNQQIKDILGDDIYSKYETKYASLINSSTNWNNLKQERVPVIFIAIYIVLHNPKPQYNLNKDYLQRIRNEVNNLKKLLNQDAIAQNFMNYYTDNSNSIEYQQTLHQMYLIGRLGEKYAKYFFNSNFEKNYDSITPTALKDIHAKYLHQEGVYVLNCANNQKDEIDIIKEFLHDIETVQDEMREKYLIARHNSKRQIPGEIPTDIDNLLKKVLSRELKSIGVHDSKIKRLIPRAIKAFKKEILKI